MTSHNISLKLQIAEIKKKHYLQRMQLELTFETTPRDSRYSTDLLSLMKKEELLLKESDTQAVRTIIQRVDEALRAETQFFFATSTQQNTKRWKLLNDKCVKEREVFIQTTEKQRKSNVQEEASLSFSTLELETERLELDYNRNWFLYENFNLQQAFKSQNTRVESDWNNHEKTLIDDFQSRHQKLTGIITDKVTNGVIVDSHDQRWQHPEKQKSLIHSAPVLTPTRPSVDSSKSMWVKGRKELELENLEKDLQAAIKSLQKQKDEARRWLLRQQVRLQAQAEEVQHERTVIAEMLQRELQDYRSVLICS